MHTVTRILNILVVILLVVATLFQTMAFISVIGGNNPKNAAALEANPHLPYVWVATILLLPAAYLLLRTRREKGKWPLLVLALAAVGAVTALLTALALQNMFPAVSDINQSYGLTPWKLIYRHYSSVAAGVLLMLEALIQLRLNRVARERKEVYKPLFSEETGALFTDDNKPQQRTNKKLSKKQRKALAAKEP